MNNTIEFACFVNNTGFSHAAIGYAKSLRGFEVDISIKSVHNSLLLDSFCIDDRKWIEECSSKKSVPCFQFRHVIPSRWRSLAKRDKNIALAVFESSSPPREWINALRSMDKVICPSNYCADVFWAAGLPSRPVVIPHAIDTNFWGFAEPRDVGGVFKIISIGTWRSRKNWKNTIKGCEIASNLNNNIHLTIKTDRGEEADKFIKENFPQNNIKIDIISSELNEEEMRKLILEHDCLLSASIGEGFCISPMQAMSCGIPVVCSAVGGCLEYASDENCIRIETRGYSRMAVMDNIPQFKNQEWAIISAEDVAEAICKMIIINKDRKIDMVKKAREFVENNFSYSIVGKKMMENIFGS